jgi:hypothetical protein
MKKRKTRKVAPAPKRRTLLETLTAAVGVYYSTDPSRAGVVLSELGNGVWYCSVVRYQESGGREKRVVCSTKQASLAGAIEVCAQRFHEISRMPKRLLLDLERSVRAMNEGPR